MEAKRIFLDTETPISVFLKLKEEGITPLYLLESLEGAEKWGRYSFIGFGKPKEKIFMKVENLLAENISPLDGIRKALSRIKSTYSGFIDDFKNEFGIKRLPFGFVGYVSYDTFSVFERSINTFEGKEGIKMPDVALIFTPNVIIFDNLKKDVIVISEDRETIEALEKIAEKGCKFKIHKIRIKEEIDRTKKSDFEEMVEEARKRIYAGDVIQVVLSRSKEFVGDIDAFSFYRLIRVGNPSPYMFFVDFGTAGENVKVVGTSPEVLVRVEGGKAETRPIAGTRKRGGTPEEDDILAQELITDEKELAEHLMLVDLARNDLGRVCKPGTVRVRKYGYVEKYSRVMHIVSDVEGQVKTDALDVFQACFPAGTVVGAPKIKAAEIISELERERRGPYAGALGYFSINGDMDTAILIRTAFFHNDRMKIQAGAGIVYYSDPEREYFETEYKMQALVDALEKLT